MESRSSLSTLSCTGPPAAQYELVRPCLLPGGSDARVTRNQNTSGDKRRQQNVELATVAYNIVNEPWLRYMPSCMADKGYTSKDFVVSRFQRDVLYLETDGCVAPMQIVYKCFSTKNSGSDMFLTKLTVLFTEHLWPLSKVHGKLESVTRPCNHACC